MASKFFREALSDRKPETKILVKESLDLLEYIHEFTAKQGMTQKELAEWLEQNHPLSKKLKT